MITSQKPPPQRSFVLCLRALIAQLPNGISILRLGLAFVCIALVLQKKFSAAFWVFLLASLSDFADGALARALRVTSRLGACLDPLADKLLIGGIFMTLGWQGRIAPFVISIVVGRDIFILAAVGLCFVRKKHLTLTPLWISKINTALQMGCVLLVLVQDHCTPMINEWYWLDVGCILLQVMIVLTTVGSSVAYAKQFWRMWHGHSGGSGV